MPPVGGAIEVDAAKTGGASDPNNARFGQHVGLASSAVTIADPATGTGTFLLGVLRRIAEHFAEDEGEAAVGPAVSDAVRKLTGVDGVGVAHFDSSDIVRHPVVSRIVDAYGERKPERGPAP